MNGQRAMKVKSECIILQSAALTYFLSSLKLSMGLIFLTIVSLTEKISPFAS
jgi:hypothetical protein